MGCLHPFSVFPTKATVGHHWTVGLWLSFLNDLSLVSTYPLLDLVDIFPSNKEVHAGESCKCIQCPQLILPFPRAVDVDGGVPGVAWVRKSSQTPLLLQVETKVLTLSRNESEPGYGKFGQLLDFRFCFCLKECYPEQGAVPQHNWAPA